MMIHTIIRSGGAMLGGLVTLGLFAYNIATLFTGNRNRSGCSIK